MNKNKLNKKELFFFSILPIIIVSFLTVLFLPAMENYWLRKVIMIGIIVSVSLILMLIIRWYRYRQQSCKDTQ